MRKAKSINELAAGDCLVRKSTGELCEITQITTDGRGSQYNRFRVLFYFNGFCVLRDCMGRMFKNDSIMFFMGAKR